MAARIAPLEAELVLLHHQWPTQADVTLVRCCGRRPIRTTYLPLLQLHPDVQALIVMQLATDTKDIAGVRAFQAFLEDYRGLRQLCHSARAFGGSSIASPLCEELICYADRVLGVEDVLLVCDRGTPPFDWRLPAERYGAYASAYRRRYGTAAAAAHVMSLDDAREWRHFADFNV